MPPTKHSESGSIQVLVELSVWARFISERERGAPRISNRLQASARVALVFPNVKQGKRTTRQAELFPNVRYIGSSERSPSSLYEYLHLISWAGSPLPACSLTSSSRYELGRARLSPYMNADIILG